MDLEQRFPDRRQAGKFLGEQLRARGYGDRADVLVLALPRGGVPVGYEVARALHAPLDLFVVRKLGVPGQEELAMGAIASGGVRVLNRQVVDMLDLAPGVIEQVTRKEFEELVRRERDYRGDRPTPDVHGKCVILVDDGLATGSTMRAAAKALRRLGPEKIVVAVPVAAGETCDILREEVDELLCPLTPEPFYAVGVWYEDFSQTSDQQVRELLARAGQELEGAPASHS